MPAGISQEISPIVKKKASHVLKHFCPQLCLGVWCFNSQEGFYKISF